MEKVLKKAKSGLTLLILLKLFMKVLDLSMNILIIRGVDKKEYGINPFQI